MPTYDYQCPEGHHFEVFQRISDEPVAQCPECGAQAKRLISGGAGFLFKGEGFYITDYRSEDYKKKASAEPGAASGGSDSASGPSDSSSGASEGGSKDRSGGDSSDAGSSSGSKSSPTSSDS
jgi:putative FmdB family regulatory protein